MAEGSIAFEYRPDRWPLTDVHRVHRIAQDGSIVDVVFFPDGHLALIVEFRGERKEHHFQRVSIEEGGIVKMAFSWSDAEVLAAAGGTALSLLDKSDGAVLDIRIKGKATYEMGHFSVDTEILSLLPREDWLFLETLADISRKVNTNSRYELVRLSALLRQLLCDGVPLVRSVNRRFKLGLQFEVAIKETKSVPSPETLWLSARSLYPDTQEEVTSVDLDRFLKLIVVTSREVDCSVSDVIGVIANVFGGVHHGQLRTNEDHALEALERELLVHDDSAVLHCLRDIGKVTLQALLPLGEQIVRSGKPASLKTNNQL